MLQKLFVKFSYFPSSYCAGLEEVGSAKFCFHLFRSISLKQLYLTNVVCVASEKEYTSESVLKRYYTVKTNWTKLYSEEITKQMYINNLYNLYDFLKDM